TATANLRARAQGRVAPKAPIREQGSVRLWDVASGREIRRLPAEGCDAHCVAFSPGGTMLAASLLDGTIRLSDPAKGDELGRLNVAGTGQGCLCFSPDGKVLASADDSDGRFEDTPAVHLWDVARRTGLRQLPPSHQSVFGLAFSPDGKTLASAGTENAV